MNSYNENLHASVVSSLNDQELELEQVQAQLYTAMFSLYYAQGARITAAEQLELANKKYKHQQNVQEQAVIDSDISTNVLASANNGKTYVAQAVTNTSVAAANVQIAANAILKLASDAGSIFSIVHAADFDTEIYQLSKEAHKLMNKTAYLAEKTSQHSMEASALVAEVSTVSLADKASTTDASIKNLLGITTADFEATTTEVATDNANLSTLNTSEKAAEGILEDTNAAYYSTQIAYDLNNKELNLDLRVSVPRSIGNATNYTVSFNQYTNPFPKYNKDLAFPVEAYYIMLVKNSNSPTFSISDAESIVDKGDTARYIKITPDSPLSSVNDGEEEDPEGTLIPLIIDPLQVEETIYTSELKDSEGKEMELGEDYVIFVLARFTLAYKRKINTFDDYITAASAKFCLTNTLNKPEASKIIIRNNEELQLVITDDLDTKKTSEELDLKTGPQTMLFRVYENSDYKVEYRGLFLPDNADLVKGLLTVEGLASIETETEGLEIIADKYDPEIAKLTSEINSLESQLSGITQQIEENNEIITNPKSTKAEKKKAEEENIALNKSEKQVKKEIKVKQKRLDTAIAEKDAALKELESDKHIKPGFFFNLTTAEQVPAGSYMVAEDATKDEIKAFEKLLRIENVPIPKEKPGYAFSYKKIVLEPETTDNFGNRLINHNLYIPAVLAISNETSVEANEDFTNSLSDFQHTESFKYQDGTMVEITF